MNVIYKNPFYRFIKKQKSKIFKLNIRLEVERIIDNVEIGVMKTGDLSGISIYKFNYKSTEYLIAYSISRESITFYKIGTHENFYDELKAYLREVT